MAKSYRISVTWLTIAALSTAAMRGTTADESNSGGCRQQDGGGTCFCNGQKRTTFDSSLCAENTVTLDLSSNNLTTLHAYMFSRFIDLKTIILNHNSIHSIDKNAFGGLMGLDEIDLTNNKLRYIYPELISGNPNLNKIHLKNNLIIIPACGPLLRSNSLRFLYLDWCGINTLVEAEVFSQLPQLRVLTLSGNDLHFVNTTPFQPLITSRTEIIKSDSKKCSDKFQETVLQLQNQINFTNKCNLSSMPVFIKSSLTTVQPTTTTERPQPPVDIALILVAAIIFACVCVVILVIFIWFVYCTLYCERKAPSTQEKLAPRVCPPTNPMTRDPFNEGYEIPSPRPEENAILDLPTEILPYLPLMADFSVQNQDTTDENNLYRHFHQHGDSSMPLLTHKRCVLEFKPPPHVHVDMDVFNSNGGKRVSGETENMDRTKENKEHMNTLRVHKNVDNEKEQSQCCDSNNPPQSSGIGYFEPPKRPKQDVNNLDRPLPVLPVKLPLSTRRVR